MQSKEISVTDYIASLDSDRQTALTTIRDTILSNLPQGYEETMNWGMISYEVPLSTYPNTYNKKPLVYAALASQKNHISLYVMAPYVDSRLMKLLQKGFADAGKTLHMGASCIKFKKLSDVPLSVVGACIGQVSVDEFIALSEKSRTHSKK